MVRPKTRHSYQTSTSKNEIKFQPKSRVCSRRCSRGRIPNSSRWCPSYLCWRSLTKQECRCAQNNYQTKTNQYKKSAKSVCACSKKTSFFSHKEKCNPRPCPEPRRFYKLPKIGNQLKTMITIERQTLLKKVVLYLMTLWCSINSDRP